MEPAPAQVKMASKYKILLVIIATVVSLDQLTKFQAVARLTSVFEHYNKVTLGERLHAFFAVKNLDNDPFTPGRKDFRKPPVEIVANYWQHKYVENPGAAWGLLSDVDERFRVPFFHVVSVIAILFIALFYRRLEPDQTLLAFALSLVLGGAIGNYIDRLARNYVVDFIDWHWRNQPGMHWPTFNVADAAICIGVGLMLLETLFLHRNERLELAEQAAGGSTGEALGEQPVTTAAAAAFLPEQVPAAEAEQPAGESPVVPEVAGHPESEAGPAETRLDAAVATGVTET